MEYQEMNRVAMNVRARSGWRWAMPFSHEDVTAIMEGRMGLRLTPTKTIPDSWFKGIKGLDFLGLASGGGQQMPIFAKLGANVTSFDISDEMLALDEMVAEREGAVLKTVQGDMTEGLPFPDGFFDLVFMPVCLCYVKEIDSVFSEIYRVLRNGGVLLTGQDNGMNYLVDDCDMLTGSFPYDPLSSPELMEECIASGSGIQFSHTSGEILKGIISVGFTITDVYEDTNPEGMLKERNIPSFIAIRAVK